ncbi:MAG: SoxR reducing system RseC family protein [Geoalkalibacter sp.]|uniref:SoxR reducing system RseC family protein n=1 Tax=Geoalkalibacter sp. TaxID=3041440 RepID=UPI003D0A1857
MMEETGKVVEIKSGEIAIVACEKNSFCKSCVASGNCLPSEGNKMRRVGAFNPIGARVGDEVIVATSTRNFLRSSFLLYIVPLIALVAGAIVGQLTSESAGLGIDPDLFSALFALAFMVASLLWIKMRSGSIAPENVMPVIRRIVSSANSESSQQHGN